MNGESDVDVLGDNGLGLELRCGSRWVVGSLMKENFAS